MCHSQNFSSNWGDGAIPESERSKAFARRALEAAPDDIVTVALAAVALMNVGEDTSILKGLITNALARNPSSAAGWLASGWMQTFSGEADLATAFRPSRLRPGGLVP
jgi:hypothetical protein